VTGIFKRLAGAVIVGSHRAYAEFVSHSVT
jgi:hypothetical protein